MRKIFCVLTIVIIFCTVLIGCADEESPTTSKLSLVGNIASTFPLVNSAASLNIMATGSGGKDQESVFVWNEYEKMTGVNINWTTVTTDTRSEAYQTALLNHQQYDLIMRCKLSATKLLRYGKSGLILDLAKDGMLKKYAPNCWAFLQSHPDTLASVMNPDGTIYGLPQVNSGAELRVGVKLFVNKTWLERVNMQLPTTTQEFRALLTAFKQQDANGNGNPDDEIPLCSADWANLRLSLYGAFGLANRGFHNTSVDCDPVSGDTRLIERSDAYCDFLQYMNGLYSDGLLDQKTFTISTDEWLTNIYNDRIGVFPMTNLAWIPADKVDNWVAIDEALTGPNGDKLWSGIRANFHSTGAAVIPSTCSNPALVLRWLDYFWTDEGTLFYHMGVKDKTYKETENGGYDYIDGIYEEMTANGKSFDEVIRQYSPYPGGSNPTVEIAPYFMGGEMAEVPAAAARALMAYGPSEYWPSFTFTQSENDVLDEINSNMSKYCNNMRTAFITGEKSFDEWDSYVAELDNLGASEMLAVYQVAVDRYHTLIAALN